MKTSKKFISMLLVTLMLLSLLPTDVFATGTHSVSTEEGLGSAISDASSGDTIKLTDNITLSKAVTIPSTKSLTIDLNGYTLSNPNGGVLVLTGNTDPNKGDEPGNPHDCLTLTGNGIISGKENSVMLTTGGDYKAADLTLAGVTITTTAGDAVYQRSLYSVITIADGTMNTITAGGASSAGIYATNQYNYIVEMEIKGNGKLYISGDYGFYMDGCFYPTITARNVYAKGVKSGYISYQTYYEERVQAGYYSNNMSDYCAAGYVSYSNTDEGTKTEYPYHVSAASNVVLTKGTEISGYSTVQDAVGAAGNTPSEIRLYKDVTENVSIASGQVITLEGMSKKLTGSITNSGKLIIMSGKYSVDLDSAWLGYALKTVQEDGTYTVVGDLPYNNGAYHISQVKHLAALQYIVNYGANDFDGEKVVLDNDIDMSTLPEAYRNWTPIGTESNYFSGTFDGCENTISKLTINSSGYLALFSFATGTIENLTMKDCSVVNSEGAGAVLAAQATGGEFTVRKCNFENCDVAAANSYSGICSGYCLADESLFEDITIDSDSSVSGYGIGSLAGYVQAQTSFTAKNCVNNAPFSVQRFGGGMVSQTDAYTKDLVFENCTNNGTLTCTNPSESMIYLAGFIGYRAPNNVTTTVFTNCKNTGNIVGDSNAGNRRFGGFIGYTAGAPCVFTNCVNSGDVSGRNAGGFIGLFNENVTTCFISCTSSGDVTSSENTKGGYFIAESLQSNMWASKPVRSGTLTCNNPITIKGETSEDPGYVARLGSPINGSYFTTLAAAVEAATDEVSDIYLLADTEETITITKILTIETGTATKESGYYTMPNVSKGTFVEIATGTLHTFEPNYVASITKDEGTKKYETLEAALTAAKDGDTIKLLTDIELTSPVRLDKTGTFTIDGNGKTLSAAATADFGGDGCLCFGDTGSELSANKKYTVKNLTFSGFTKGINDIVRAEGCALTLNGCTFKENTVSGASRSSAVVIFSNVKAEVFNCEFKNNTAGLCIDFNTQAGDTNANTSSSLKTDNCLFKENILTGNGVIYTYGPQGTITNSTFDSNKITADGVSVIYLSGKADSIANNLFTNNIVIAKGSGKCGVICFGSGAKGSSATENAFINNTFMVEADGVVTSVVTVGAENISLEKNYWGDGKAAEIGAGKDIYNTKPFSVSTFATAYAGKNKSYGFVVTLVEKVAKIGEKVYYTYDDAKAAAPDGFTEGFFNLNPAADVKTGYNAVASTDSEYLYMVVEKTTTTDLNTDITPGTKDAEVKVDETGKTPEQKQEAKEVADSAKEAINSSAVGGAEALRPDAASKLNDASVVNDELVTAAENKLAEAKIEYNSETDTMLLVVEPYFDITVTDGLKESSKITAITYDIDSKYNILVTTAATPEQMVLEGENKNTTVLETDRELNVTHTVTMRIPLPASFDAIKDEKVYVRHTHNENEYLYEGTIIEIEGVKYVEFENPNGFSEFEIFVKGLLKGAKIERKSGTYCFDNLSDAVKNVKDNETIVLLSDSSESIEIAREVTFKVDAGEFKNDATITAAKDFKLAKDGNTYTVTAIIKPAIIINGDSEVRHTDVKTYTATFVGVRPKDTYIVWEVSGCNYTYMSEHINADSVTIVCDDVGTLHISATLIDKFGRPVKDYDGKIIEASKEVTVKAESGNIINLIVTAIRIFAKLLSGAFGSLFGK